MKLLFHLFLLCCFNLSGQTILEGVVTDQATKAPLHFATIAVVGQPYGTLSEIDGKFVLTAPGRLGPETNIQISFLGYATRQYSLGELQSSGDVSLSSAGVNLPVAKVSAADIGPLTDISLGRKEKKAFTFYQSTFDQTYQLATRINNPEKRTGVLQTAYYYFGRAAKSGKPVRINFYANDPSCDCPGESLHSNSIIPDKVKKRWNKLDLTPHLVVLPAGDFFVAFEWLGLKNTASANLDFSVGIIPDKAADPTFEKIGGSGWQKAVKQGVYRPLVRVQGKVE